MGEEIRRYETVTQEGEEEEVKLRSAGDRSKRQFFIRTMVVNVCHLGTENRFELDCRNICCVVQRV